ncbi:DUF6479 family protein [Streptomyces sp. NPDC058572]|uniref:DUF6479 family protein n=1 Tax=Streptomyces sp. NPDC058572 TaxID=3346546 RepID=UPI003654AFCE
MVTFSSSAADAPSFLAAGEGAPAVIVFSLIVIGLLVLLVWVVMEMGRRRRDTAPQREEIPKPPDHGTHIESRREPDAFEPDEQLWPHEMPGYGNLPSRPAPEPPKPPRDSDDSGGSGSGSGSGGQGG